MKKKVQLAFISVLLFLAAAGTQMISLTKANPFPTDPIISIESPVDKTYTVDSIVLNVIVVTKYEGWYITASAKTLVYRLDGETSVSITETNYSYDEEHYESTFTGSAILSELTDGPHSLTVYAEYDYGDRIFEAQSSTYFTIDLPNGTSSPTPTPELSPSPKPQDSEPLPTIIASASLVTTAGAGFLFYFKKRKRRR